MKTPFSLAAWLLACALATSGCAATSIPVRLGAFSFDYLLAGEGVARPVQVFDDGRQTFLQYRPGLPLPVLVSVDGEQLFLPRQHGPYVVIDAVPGDLVAQLAGSRVRITQARLAARSMPLLGAASRWLGEAGRSTSAAREEATVLGAAGTNASPLPRPAGNAWAENSYAAPARGDRLEWRERDEVTQDFTLGFPAGSAGLSPQAAKLLRTRAPVLSQASRIQVVGREDGSGKEGLAAGRAATVADQLVAVGIPRARIDVRVSREGREAAATGEVPGVAVSAFAGRVYAPPPAAPSRKPALPRFQLRAADATLAANLQRWAAAQGWRVVLQEAPEVKVVGDADLEQSDFLAAAEYAIAQARQAGYPIRAAAYANQVLVLAREEAP